MTVGTVLSGRASAQSASPAPHRAFGGTLFVLAVVLLPSTSSVTAMQGPTTSQGPQPKQLTQTPHADERTAQLA